MSEMVDRVLDKMLSLGLMAEEGDAIALIRAMREPTEAMNRAGWPEIDERSPYDAIDNIWRAMIDEALK